MHNIIRSLIAFSKISVPSLEHLAYAICMKFKEKETEKETEKKGAKAPPKEHGQSLRPACSTCRG